MRFVWRPKSTEGGPERQLREAGSHGHHACARPRERADTALHDVGPLSTGREAPRDPRNALRSSIRFRLKSPSFPWGIHPDGVLLNVLQLEPLGGGSLHWELAPRACSGEQALQEEITYTGLRRPPWPGCRSPRSGRRWSRRTRRTAWRTRRLRSRDDRRSRRSTSYPRGRSSDQTRCG